MTVQTQKFLETYKKLEQALNGTSVLDYENTLDADTSDKLRLCRITRNYIQHHSDKTEFASVSQTEINFLENLRKSIENKEKKTKDAATKLRPVEYNIHSIANVTDRLITTGRNWLPVVDQNKKLLGVITQKRIIKLIRDEIFVVQKKPNALFSPSPTILKNDMVSLNIVPTSDAIAFTSLKPDKEYIVTGENLTYIGVISMSNE